MDNSFIQVNPVRVLHLRKPSFVESSRAHVAELNKVAFDENSDKMWQKDRIHELSLTKTYLMRRMEPFLPLSVVWYLPFLLLLPLQLAAIKTEQQQPQAKAAQVAKATRTVLAARCHICVSPPSLTDCGLLPEVTLRLA